MLVEEPEEDESLVELELDDSELDSAEDELGELLELLLAELELD